MRITKTDALTGLLLSALLFLIIFSFSTTTAIYKKSSPGDNAEMKIVGGVIAKTSRGSIFTNPVIWSLSFMIILLVSALSVFVGSLFFSKNQKESKTLDKH